MVARTLLMKMYGFIGSLDFIEIDFTCLFAKP